MERYKEYGKALVEYQGYTKAINDKVRTFRKDIAAKELEIAGLQEQYAKDFISGINTDDKKIKELKIEISYLKEQLEMINQSIQIDTKIKELANRVLEEYRELQKVIKLHYQEEEQAIEELERKYKEDRQKIFNDRVERKRIVESQYIYPREKAIPYMDNLGKIEKIAFEGRL